MPKREERSDVRLVGDMESINEDVLPGDDTPFIFGVLGEFTEHRNGSDAAESRANRSFIEIDRDNFNDVMERFNITLAVELDVLPGQQSESGAVQLALRGIESFHPDEIVKQVKSLHSLVELRSALQDPRQFSAAAAEIQRLVKSTDTPTQSPRAKTPGNLLDTILEEGNASSRPLPRKDRPADIERLVQEIVGPHEIRVDAKRQSQLTALVDALLTESVRAILHHSEFQRLEAAWRALYFLVMRAETDANLKIYLLNVSKAELAADLKSSGDIADSRLYKVLSLTRGQSWGAFVGAYDFSIASDDVDLLDRIAQIARRVKAPFFTAAGPRFFNTSSFVQFPSERELSQSFRNVRYESWQKFQQSPQADSLGLFLPRFLLRLPYGADTEPINAFPFEESTTGKDHDKYVWGNPAFAFAVLVAREFSENGWSANLARRGGELADMPIHVYEDSGATEAKPCSEVLLPESVVETLEEQGFVPLLSYRGKDTIVIRRPRSVAIPPAPLAGRW